MNSRYTSIELENGSRQILVLNEKNEMFKGSRLKMESNEPGGSSMTIDGIAVPFPKGERLLVEIPKEDHTTVLMSILNC